MNFAIFQNVIFTRDEGEDVPSFQARVRESVAAAGGGALAWGIPQGLEWIEPADDVGADDEGIAVGLAPMA
jgi:hypothetical protein